MDDKTDIPALDDLLPTDVLGETEAVNPVASQHDEADSILAASEYDTPGTDIGANDVIPSGDLWEVFQTFMNDTRKPGTKWKGNLCIIDSDIASVLDLIKGHKSRTDVVNFILKSFIKAYRQHLLETHMKALKLLYHT